MSFYEHYWDSGAFGRSWALGICLGWVAGSGRRDSCGDGREIDRGLWGYLGVWRDWLVLLRVEVICWLLTSIFDIISTSIDAFTSPFIFLSPSP